MSYAAKGFAGPATGVIYRATTSPVVCGMSLGGIDTGCIDLETSGLLGYCTIFNSHVPRREPMNVPFLGLAVGQEAWVLSTMQAKPLQAEKTVVSGDDIAEAPALPRLQLEGVKTAKDIQYWGHYPVADLEYETDAPISVGLRAWAPFIPGDVGASMLPGAVFEVNLRNETRESKRGTVVLSFPGPAGIEATKGRFSRRHVSDAFRGVTVDCGEVSYALGATEDTVERAKLRVGGQLGTDGTAWAEIASALPPPSEDNSGASVAVDVVLAPREGRVLRFVLAWYSPIWMGGGNPSEADTNAFTHMYATRYSSAAEVATLLAQNHEPLLRRVLAWQEEIYAAPELPDWLKDSLINILYLITEDGLWAAAKPPIGAWCKPEDGLFGMIESPRACPQIECLICSWYGNLPLVYFFPELALSTLRGYKAYQDDEGSPPWVFGGCTTRTPPCEMTMPSRGYQVVENGASYVDMVDKYWLRTGDEDFLREFYPSVKKATSFTMSLNHAAYGVIGMPDRKVSEVGVGWETEAFEWVKWRGATSRVGGRKLAQLRMAQRMAERMGDQEFASMCREWLARGSNAMEELMWAGRYYLALYEPETGRKMDTVFGYQMDGQWVVDFHGLDPVFRKDRVRLTLDTIRRVNVALTRYGAVNFANPDGTLMPSDYEFLHAGYEPYDFFPPEALILAMTYMYHGSVEFGLDLARQCWENIVLVQRLIWDAPNIINGNTGRAKFGTDYYQNMMLWALPAVLEGGDMTGIIEPGRLVDRVLKAGQVGAIDRDHSETVGSK